MSESLYSSRWSHAGSLQLPHGLHALASLWFSNLRSGCKAHPLRCLPHALLLMLLHSKTAESEEQIKQLAARPFRNKDGEIDLEVVFCVIFVSLLSAHTYVLLTALLPDLACGQCSRIMRCL